MICAHCDEPIQPAEINPHYSANGGELYYHRNCFLRLAIGPAAHQLEICSCFDKGSTETDPPELTVRQAADLAVELWEAKQNYLEET